MVAIQRTTTATSPSWDRQFTFRDKTLFYNRIAFNNRAERAVEVPIAFDFLATWHTKEPLLEIGNVLQHYENGLSDALRLRARRIVDKFELGDGIDNVDLMDLDAAEKYGAIVSISTVEHVGQHCSPDGQFGEQQRATDFEAPLKAIAKIYDLLAVDGHALITVPFGKLIDGGWYIQFSDAYLNLLTSSYGLPQQAITISFLKRAAVELKWHNPYQRWVEVEASELNATRYQEFIGGAQAIAVIELTKLPEPFTLNVALPPAPLPYEQARIAKNLIFNMGLLLRLFNR
ncbi:MAG: hypothetical protein NVS2B12_07300 [Ktedonobacteraceae bacterium]